MGIKSAKIRQGTTPALDIILNQEAIQDCTVYVTIDQGSRQLMKTNYHKDPSIIVVPIYDEEGTQIGSNITVILSQAETLWLRPGHGKVQVRWIGEDGIADSSEIARIEIPKSLYKGVIAYG